MGPHFTTELTIMGWGYIFKRVSRMGSHIFSILGGQKIQVGRDSLAYVRMS